MSELTYLEDGLFGEDGAPRPQLAAHAAGVARAWAACGVDPAAVEILSEYLARVATRLGAASVQSVQLAADLDFLEPAPPVLELVSAALPGAAGAREVAAVAVHLVDIAEAMALALFIPELPSLFARSDRSGDAARNVGLARHLRG